MATYDGRALRVQLQADYATLAHGIKDAKVLNEIYEALTGTVLRTMRDLLNQWNHGRAVERLPPEVLVSVFVWLPFRERVRASHVSRSWRTASLNYPAVWAEINLTGLYRDKHRLLDMALSRTGEHPVDLEIQLVHPVDDLVTTALKNHTHHIRTFIWSSEHGSPLNASLPAPMLEVWQSEIFVVPTDFLCGVPGKLRKLHVQLLYLPETCPALSTLTELVIDSETTDERSAGTFGRLFTLCPALQSFTYCKMPAEFANQLPGGKAPASLTKIALGTRDDGYDLTQHFLAWRTDALQDVTLHMAYGMAPNLEPLLAGTLELTVVRDGGLHELFQTIVTADGPGERTHTVGLADTDDEQVRLAKHLLDFRGSLSSVHTLRISLHMLDAYAELFAALPALKHVLIYIESDNIVPEEGAEPETRAPHVFAGDLLTALVRLQTDRPELESLAIKVICWDDACPPTADDARDLVAQLQLLQERTLPEIRVKGFSVDIVRAVEVPAGRPNVIFELEDDS